MISKINHANEPPTIPKNKSAIVSPMLGCVAVLRKKSKKNSKNSQITAVVVTTENTIINEANL